MSYRGHTATIQLGEIGLMTDLSPDKIPVNALIRANNVCFTEGAVQKAPGSLRWNLTALPAPVVAVHDWHPSTVRQYLIAATSTGHIYKGQDRTFSSAVNAGLGTLTPNSSFCEGGNETAGRVRKLFFFTDGVEIPYVLRGEAQSFVPIAKPNTDWTTGQKPKFGVIFGNRLWTFAGQMSYASDSGDHENFATNSLTEPVFPGEGGELRGAFVFKSLLFAFKDGGFVYKLNSSAQSDTQWFWEKVSNNFGLSAPNAVAEVLDNLFSFNVTGTITDYGATEKFGSVEAGDLIQILGFENYLRGNTSKAGIFQQHLLYYPEKKWLLGTYRSHYRQDNDMLLMFDFARISTVRPAFWIKGSPQCLALRLDHNRIQRPMYGGADGFVYLLDQEDRNEGGVAYRGEFQTPHMTFSHLGERIGVAEKNFDALSVTYRPEGAGDLKCDYFIDGRFIETLTFPMTQYQAPVLDEMMLDEDRLSQGNTETVIRPLRGAGRTFSARFYNEGLNESFQVTAVTVMFRGGGDDATKTKAGGK